MGETTDPLREDTGSSEQATTDNGPWWWTAIKILFLILTWPWGIALWFIWDWAQNLEPIEPHGGSGSSASFYRTPTWKRLRRRCKNRDNWTCQSCGASGPGTELHAHHKISRSRGGTRRIGQPADPLRGLPFDRTRSSRWEPCVSLDSSK